MITKKLKPNYRSIPRKYFLVNMNSDVRDLKCKECGRILKHISGLSSHLLSSHKMLLEDYIIKHFKCLSLDFKIEKCGFCNRNALPFLQYDFVSKTYQLNYADGYDCGTMECRDAICLDFFGEHYDKSSKKYEHIGANVKYLVKRYKTTEDFVRTEMKHNKDYVLPIESRTSLEGYIARYGKKEGTKKYHERCAKISKAQTFEWYIEKYGLEEGTRRFQEKQSLTANATKDITHSKNQYKIFNQLKALDINWKDERFAGGFAQVDMVNEKLGVIIEYFGDYWHCNPKDFKPTQYNKSLHMTAQEKWIKDDERLNKILARSKTCSLIIVIWEKSYVHMKDQSEIIRIITKMVDDHKKKNKKEILWF